ncbi:hypothetical protein P9139_06225 [Curtobacterium flaccumfaciens]|nr:hypothetical protein P9139_06225 [Curtobacterium flaccumfaciens]
MARTARTFGVTLAAGVAAIGLAVLPAVSASAATAVTNDYGASLSVTGPASVVTDGSGALNGVSNGTVTVTGDGFDGNAGGRGFGVYVVYGPRSPTISRTRAGTARRSGSRRARSRRRAASRRRWTCRRATRPTRTTPATPRRR